MLDVVEAGAVTPEVIGLKRTSAGQDVPVEGEVTLLVLGRCIHQELLDSYVVGWEAHNCLNNIDGLPHFASKAINRVIADYVHPIMSDIGLPKLLVSISSLFYSFETGHVPVVVKVRGVKGR